MYIYICILGYDVFSLYVWFLARVQTNLKRMWHDLTHVDVPNSHWLVDEHGGVCFTTPLKTTGKWWWMVYQSPVPLFLPKGHHWFDSKLPKHRATKSRCECSGFLQFDACWKNINTTNYVYIFVVFPTIWLLTNYDVIIYIITIYCL